MFIADCSRCYLCFNSAAIFIKTLKTKEFSTSKIYIYDLIVKFTLQTKYVIVSKDLSEKKNSD